MKTIFKFLIYSMFLVILLFTDCSKKEPICACGVINVHENLPWLKNSLLNIWSTDIYMVNYLDTEYIILSDKDIIRDGISVAYNCQGQKVCEEGGENIGSHPCNISDPNSFWETYYSKKVLLLKIRAQKVIETY